MIADQLSIPAPQPALTATVGRMDIRDAQASDARGIAEVHVGSWQVAYAHLLPKEDLAQLDVDQFAAWRGRRIQAMDPANSATLLITDDDGIAGFADVGPTRDEYLDATTVGELYAIYLDPSRWDKGYGSELIRAAEAAMARLGFRSAMLWVLEGNDRAREFYAAAGWEPDGGRQLEQIISVALHEVRYTKELN